MGPKLRKALLAIFSVAGVLVLLLFAFLFWYTGEMHNRFGVLPTTKDLKEQTDNIAENMATKEELATLGDALYVYQDSLLRLRSHLDTTLIGPGLMAIVDLQRRMAKLESGQVETRVAIEEQKRQGQLSAEQLLDQMNRNSSAEARAKENQARSDREQREKDRRLMEAIAKKLKINTQEF